MRLPRWTGRALLSAAVVAALAAGGAQARQAAAATAGLQVGVGRADITPPTGYYLQGWVRSDSTGQGVHTRLFARAIVLAEGGRKVALVAEDLNGIAAGVVVDALRLVGDPALTPQTVLVSATHTHAAPSGYFPYGTYNTVFMTIHSPTMFNVAGQLDPALYAFEVRQLAAAVRAADRDLGPGRAGWGSTQLVGLTQNRSLEAHLANFGITEAKGSGRVSQDPRGYVGTIDPQVDVLRVDKTVAGHDVPVGLFTTFADHGTVNKSTFTVYNGDHHAAADRMVEAALRAAGGPARPAGQDVVSAYGNGDEGDQTAGIAHSGPADAQWVGEVEAAAFLRAWSAAALSSHPVLDGRWTQVAMASQPTSAGATGTRASPGLPLFTGSEEGRGGLYDITGQAGVDFEGDHLPADNPTDGQGDKIETTFGATGGFPTAVPLAVLRIGSRTLATVPGEMTVGMGARLRASLSPVLGTPVVIDGLTGEYLSYFTTPQEYEAQHYEGGSTQYGEFSSYLILDGLQRLSADLAAGRPAAAGDRTDPRNGVALSSAQFSSGAPTGTLTGQPAGVARLQRASVSWTGGAKGSDLPLGRPFITVQQLGAGGARDVTTDLGLAVIWRVSGSAATTYTASWEVPRDAALGAYRFRITANHYALTSAPFSVRASTALRVVAVPGGLALHYPAAVENVDITSRPVGAASGHVGTAPLRAGVAPAVATVPAGAAQDSYGNCNGRGYGDASTVALCPAAAAAATGVGSGQPADAAAPTAGGRLAVTGGLPWAMVGLTLAGVAGAGRWAGRRRRSAAAAQEAASSTASA